MKFSNQQKILLVLLVVAGGAYLTMIPFLNRMKSETKQYETVAAERDLEAKNMTSKQLDLDKAKTVAEKNPEDAKLQMTAAEACLQANLWKETVKYSRNASRLAPREVAPLVSLAIASKALGQFQAAIEAYREALKIDPDEPRSLVGLSTTYLSFGWTSDAKSLLQTAIQKDPQNIHLKFALGLAEIQNSNFAGAEKLLLEVKEQAPDEAELWSPLAELYVSMKRLPEAKAIANESLLKKPNQIAVLNELGIAQYESNDIAGCIATFQTIQKINSESVTAKYYLGLCEQKQNHLPEAIAYFEAVLKVDPAYNETQLLLGKLYLRTGKENGKEAEGRKLLLESKLRHERQLKTQQTGHFLSLHPNSPEAHFNRATLYTKEGEHGKAQVELKRTQELKPDYPGLKEAIANSPH